jgi:hypothetical protein
LPSQIRPFYLGQVSWQLRECEHSPGVFRKLSRTVSIMIDCILPAFVGP